MCLRLSKSLPFLFYTSFLFLRIGRHWLRQAVCKTVARVAVKVQIFPDAPFQFWILDFGFWINLKNLKLLIQTDYCERNSNG